MQQATAEQYWAMMEGLTSLLGAFPSSRCCWELIEATESYLTNKLALTAMTRRSERKAILKKLHRRVNRTIEQLQGVDDATYRTFLQETWRSETFRNKYHATRAEVPALWARLGEDLPRLAELLTAACSTIKDGGKRERNAESLAFHLYCRTLTQIYTNLPTEMPSVPARTSKRALVDFINTCLAPIDIDRYDRPALEQTIARALTNWRPRLTETLREYEQRRESETQPPP